MLALLCAACSDETSARNDVWFETYQNDPTTMQHPMKKRMGPIDRSEPF